MSKDISRDNRDVQRGQRFPLRFFKFDFVLILFVNRLTIFTIQFSSLQIRCILNLLQLRDGLFCVRVLVNEDKEKPGKYVFKGKIVHKYDKILNVTNILHPTQCGGFSLGPCSYILPHLYILNHN